MDALQEKAIAALRSVVDRYSAGEAEVVRVYFQQPHSDDDHVEALLRQMGREVQRGKWIDRFGPIAAELERSVDRHVYAGMLKQMAEETEHYVLLADLVEWLAGRKLGADTLLKYEAVTRYEVGSPFEQVYNPLLPEANKLLRVAREVTGRLGADRSRALIQLAEGGGGGAFVEAARVGGDPFRDRLSAAMRLIVSDEVEHGPNRIVPYAERWVHREAEIEGDVRGLSEYMAQHVRVRNEIWGNPLTAERLAAIDRGEVTPVEPLAASAAG